MKNGVRQSAAWLHTWSGLLLGWLCFVIFLTGTLAYYREEISLWMRPELDSGPFEPAALERVVADLAEAAPDAPNWQVNLVDERHPHLRTYWVDPDSGAYRSEFRDAASGAPLEPRESQGGDFFYRLHFELLLPATWGRLLAGLCAAFMLVAIVSGIVTHRRFFADFFTFRPAASGQRAWLDAHNVFGVLGLPFHLVIVYSGLVTLMTLYMPWPVLAAYGSERAAFVAEAYGGAPPARRSGEAAPLAPLPDLLARAASEMAPERPARLLIERPGDSSARVTVFASDAAGLSARPGALVFDGVTGALLERQLDPSAARQTWNVLYGLHLGRFAGLHLRFVFFVAGLAGTAMVGSGLVLWSMKRRERHRHFGHRLVDVLNLAVIAGLPLAAAAYFWANRLLPSDMVARADWEVRVFLLAWLTSLFLAALSPRRWSLPAAATALLFLALPLPALLAGQAMAFDAVAGLSGLLFLFTALYCWRRGA